ncbi:lysyl-tRNA synthetase [Teratosphaeriaceae sp. CCFEE 6253]|nr:lysyl-tRNA synthetase [Teratosphaeriaceae sp. CCFEE 6253]
MSEEPRRSGRATKGHHTKASSSPAPNAQKPAKSSKSKGKKAPEEAGGDDEEDDVIRCICGNDDPADKRAFVGCDACLAWQHNVCMGLPEEDDEVPEHYFCEECRPNEHKETLTALANGEAIWEVRLAKWRSWQKMSKSRRRSKNKGEVDGRPPWLKAEFEDDGAGDGDGDDVMDTGSAEPEETGTKRKRDSVKPELAPDAGLPAEETTIPAARPDKRRKSSQAPGRAALDADTAVVDMDQLPEDRKKGAQALSKIILDDLQDRVKAGFDVPEGYSEKTLADRHASLIEYALFMNHGKPTEKGYGNQYRTLYANLKRNKVLIERLLEDSLSADELAVMESSAMASEEQQLEWKRMKEEEDRKTVVVADEGPRYRSDHKGLERIEDERMENFGGNAQPVRERTSIGEDGEGSPPAAADGGAQSPTQGPLAGGGARRVSAAPGIDRRTSSQHQFDMNNIWQKTGSAQSPTTATGPRPMQMPPRRRSSAVPVNPQPDDGAKDDPDVDRMLQDDDDAYEPHGYTSDETVVWHGRLVHTGEGEPLVNARFVAGRDMAATAAWRDILAPRLVVDGRLAVAKAEEYLCGLQWSQNSDVSVLALTAVDDMDAFNKVFEYFLARGRYAVIKEDKPGMVKDLYIIPVEKGGPLPEHIGMLEHNMLRAPAEERLMLATFVVARAPLPQRDGGNSSPPGGQPTLAAGPPPSNGGPPHAHLPPHLRAGGAPGPAGSPLNASAPTFSPSHPYASTAAGGIPPSPYEPQVLPPQSQAAAYAPPPPPPQQANPLVAEILGPRQWDPTALQIVATDPGMDGVKLRNLRAILEGDVVARTDIGALARKLGI